MEERVANENTLMGINKYTYHKDDKNINELLSKQITKLINTTKKQYKEIIVLCIGTDRSTGDSFAPLIGTFIERKLSKIPNVKLLGTLSNPIHAKNLESTLKSIDQKNNLVIALDACLGKNDHIGQIQISNGTITPGSGVGKELPQCGDISIVGVVNLSGFMEFMVLQNTSLSLVYEMSSIVSKSLIKSVKKISKNEPQRKRNIDIAI